MLEAVLKKRKKQTKVSPFKWDFPSYKISLKKEDELRFLSRNANDVDIEMIFIESEMLKVLLFIS